MGPQMPGLNGIGATRGVLAEAPHVRVLVLTMFDDHDSVVSAMRAGARGYVLKSAAPPEVVGTLRSVAGGEARFGPQIASRLTGFLREPAADPSRAFPELTAREREILDRIARGHDNDGISARLSLSPNTVRNHVSRIFAKLGVPAAPRPSPAPARRASAGTVRRSFRQRRDLATKTAGSRCA